MNHAHDNARPCPHCQAVKNQTGGDKEIGDKLRTFLGVCGCFSCYVAMFPAVLFGIVGIFGISSSQTLGTLNAYRSSILFQPILIISILLLLVGLLRCGKIPLSLSVLAGIGIFASMNFYMKEWLFTLSFGVLVLAYYLAFQKTKAQQLKIALILLLAVVVLGVIDLGRATLFSILPSQPANPNYMDMMMQ